MLNHKGEPYAEFDMTPLTVQFTMAFQCFVFMQMFNQINARKLGEKDYNICDGIFSNRLFLVITVATFAIQLLCVQFGGIALRCVPLDSKQNTFSIGLAFTVLPMMLLFKAFVPASWFETLAQSVDDREMGAEEMQESLIMGLSGKLKRSATLQKANASTIEKKMSGMSTDAKLDMFKKVAIKNKDSVN